MVARCASGPFSSTWESALIVITVMILCMLVLVSVMLAHCSRVSAFGKHCSAADRNCCVSPATLQRTIAPAATSKIFTITNIPVVQCRSAEGAPLRGASARVTFADRWRAAQIIFVFAAPLDQ